MIAKPRLACCSISILAIAAATATAQTRREIVFPDIPGYKTILCDFHTHTVFSDGNSKLIALNAKTGEPISSFGENGRVDLLIGLNRRATLKTHQVNSPPVICRDVIVTGCVIGDAVRSKEGLRGDVRAYDVRTGEKLWQFVSIPQEGELGNETWEDESWKYSGNTNVWSLISADEDLNYVYLPFGAATSDYYGGDRPGDNLFANSLVCVDAATGKRVWHFQTVHHDLWDYDIPCAPNLVDVVVDGKPIKAVAQVSKTGMCYVFDRVTGEPIQKEFEQRFSREKNSNRKT
jgi:quinoprotein glucose dehydrogenase